MIGLGKEYVESGRLTLDVSTVLAFGSACFLLPYLLLAAPAGYLADRFSKRSVIVICKVAEIVIMTIAGLAIWIGNVYLMFFVVALIGSQAALFGPAKLGSIPEMLRAEQNLVRQRPAGADDGRRGRAGHGDRQLAFDRRSHRQVGARALVDFGTRADWHGGGRLDHEPDDHAAESGCAGTHVSLGHGDANGPRSENAWRSDRAMLRVALGIMFFWSLGLLVQLNIDQFAFHQGATEQQQVSALLAALIVGVGIGSVLAGMWSGGKVELGILPLGAGGLAICSLLAVHGGRRDCRPERGIHVELHCGLRVPGAARHQLRVVRRAAGRVHAGPQPARASRLDPGGQQFSHVRRHADRFRAVLGPQRGERARR